MKASTITYLDGYIDTLARVRTEKDAYNSLCNWHYRTAHLLGSVTSDLNAHLQLKDIHELKPHIATSSAGSLSQDIVILSANPGYSDRKTRAAPSGRSALEHAHRMKSEADNAEFCRDFFQQYPKVCGGYAPYWTKVLRLLEDVGALDRANDTRTLWQNAFAQRIGLGGIDLLPFHSTKDGITRHLHTSTPNHKLRQVALATLAMAMRLRPKILLVTSAAGQELIQNLFASPARSWLPRGFTLSSRHVNAPHPYDKINAWSVSSAGQCTTTVITFPYQIFSGSFRRNTPHYQYCPREFAKHLTKHL